VTGITEEERDSDHTFAMDVPVSERPRVPAVLAVALAGVLASLGCESTATGASGGSGAVADPTLLPVASGQAPNVAAYDALNLVNQPAGFSYNDPVTHVKIWKVTSGTIPAVNTSAGHDYADGGNRASLGWGPDNNSHTILIRGDGMAYHLVDFTRGVGFSNYRVLPAGAQPDRDLCFSFSNLASQPRIAYVLHNGVLLRFNTQTMQLEHTGNFPHTLNAFAWLQHDRNDVWFVGLVNATTAFAWNGQTNQYLTHSESWLDEGRLERDGRYVVLTNGGGQVRLWDLSDNSFGPTQNEGINFWFAHNASLRSRWVTADVNVSAPFAEDRYAVSGGSVVKTQILNQSAGTLVHHAGNWVQSDAELGGDLNRQWSFLSGYDDDPRWANSVLWQHAIGVQRSDGSDQRLLLHHYSVNPGPSYWAIPWGTPSPDGKVVIFNSNMNGAARYDLFVAEMPLR